MNEYDIRRMVAFFRIRQYPDSSEIDFILGQLADVAYHGNDYAMWAFLMALSEMETSSRERQLDRLVTAREEYMRKIGPARSELMVDIVDTTIYALNRAQSLGLIFKKASN